MRISVATALLGVVMVSVALCGDGLAASGDPWVEQQKLTAPGGLAGDEFGRGVALQGDTLLAGTGNDVRVGAAYVYSRSGGVWTYQAALTAGDGVAGDRFGQSIAIDGNTAVVGAYRRDNITGAAYVFERNGGVWTQVAKLEASDPAIHKYFGGIVSISGDSIAIAGHGDQSFKGAVYVFDKPPAGWADMTETAKLTASDGVTWDRFGSTVCIDGDTLVSGAWYDGVGGVAECGSAYVFTRSGTVWTEAGRLSASDAAAYDHAGGEVYLQGDRVIVGAYADDGAAVDCGSAYIFDKPVTGWAGMTESAKLTASDADQGDYFGSAVSVEGNRVVVGARRDSEHGQWAGAAYVFEHDGTWSQIQKLTASDAAAGEELGVRLALDGDTIAVGAYRDSAGTGAVYVYVPEPATLALLALGGLALIRRRREF